MSANSVFRESTIRICGSLDFPRALKSCFDYLQDVLPLHGIYVNFLEEDDQIVRCLAMHSHTHGSRRNISIPLNQSALKYVDEFRRDSTSTSAVHILAPSDNWPMSNLEGPILGYENRSMMVQYLALEGNYKATLLVSAKDGEVFENHHRDIFSQLNKPFCIAVSNALVYDEMNHLKDRLKADNRELTEELQQHHGQTVIGEFSGLRHVMKMVRQVASLHSTVLLLGETGVGKEVIAQAIHRSSARAKGPFIKVNCGAIAESLIDSELFGHNKGAFTGAIATRKGRFERAHGGTIFLDEIGELPPSAQVRLLRVLQTRQLERVGDDRTIEVDIRVIVATHCNLEAMVADGLFRDDLYFRLNTFPLNIPPLRQRKEDIPLFLEYFLRKKAQEFGYASVGSVAAETIDRLANYHWPGNVRELENAVERALIMSPGEELLFDELGFEELTEAAHATDNGSYPYCVFPCLAASSSCGATALGSTLPSMEQMLRRHIQDALRQCDYQIHGHGGAAELLGLNPNTLRSKMSKLGLSFKSG